MAILHCIPLADLAHHKLLSRECGICLQGFNPDTVFLKFFCQAGEGSAENIGTRHRSRLSGLEPVVIQHPGDGDQFCAAHKIRRPVRLLIRNVPISQQIQRLFAGHHGKLHTILLTNGTGGDSPVSLVVNLPHGSAMLVGIFKNFLNKHIRRMHPFVEPIMGKRFTENRHAIPQPHVIGEVSWRMMIGA